MRHLRRIANKTMARRFRFSVLTLLCGMLLASCLPAFAASSTTTTLAVSPASAAAGSVITMTATVTSGGTPLSGGKVNFCNASAPHCEDSAVLGTVWVTRSGTATLRRELRTGSTNVTAVFIGNNLYTGSSSTTQTVVVTGVNRESVTIAAAGSRGNYTLSSVVTGYGFTSPTGPVSYLDTTDSDYLVASATLTPATTAPSVFNSSQLISSPAGNIVSGDFKNDGYTDIVNSCTSILLGSQPGTFTAGSPLPNSGGCGQFAVADLNGDGNLDLVEATGSEVYILLGRGDGTFTVGTSLAGGSSPESVAIGDFNGDGIPDLVVGGTYGFDIYLGRGDGTFTGPTAYGVTGSGNISSIQVADFNGDGHDDIAIAVHGYMVIGFVEIFLGNSSGTLTESWLYTCGSNHVPTTEVGDFNNDGIPDLLVIDSTAGTLGLFIGTGTGTFPASPTVISTGGVFYPSYLSTVGDFNGDGNLDIAVLTAYNYGNPETDNSIVWLMGKGNGTFSLTTATGDSWIGFPSIQGLMAADTDGDGLPNVIEAEGDLKIYSYISTSTASVGGVSVPGSGTHYVLASSSDVVSNTVALLGSQTPTVTQITKSTPNPSLYGSSVTFSVLVNGDGASPAPTGTVSFFNGATNLGSASVTTSASTTNLAPYSEAITTSPWGPYCGAATNQTPNAVAAPDGTITATQFVMPSSFSCGSGVSWGAIDSIVGGLITGQSYTTSVWLRGASGGEVVDIGVDDCNMSAVTLTTSWQRYQYTIPSYSSCEPTRGFQILSYSANATYYAWGAQTEASASMGPYVATYGASSASGAGAVATFSTASIPAGAQAITAVYNGDSNWLGSTSAAVTQNVTPAVLTVTANNASKVYGAGNPAFTASYSGFQNGDTAAVLSGSPTFTTTATASSPVGAYPITPAAGSLSAANYTFVFANGSLTITPSALNVTANNALRTFDVANPAFTATYIGFVNGDTSASLTTQPTCTTTAVLLSPVGTYPITCSGAVDANYTVTYTAGTLTIGKVTLVPMTSFTFTSSLNPSTYGAGVTFMGTIPAAATGTMQFLDNGIAMGSPVAVSAGVATYTTAALPVGTQTITAQYSGDSNYNAATSPAVSQVVNTAILTVTANNASKVYGTANPSFTPSYSGFVNGDTSAVLSGSPALTTAATASSPVGTYPITAAVGTLSAANYTFVFTNGTLSITKATSTLSVSSTINPSTYGQTITFTLTVAGSGSGVTPTGTVTLTEGGTTLLGTTTLNGSGTATYTTSTLPVGVNTLQLNYSGDSNYY